jgi:maltooligosyltrehalose trehalohydrolase
VGVTVLEVMPVAEFPGRFGWGYDGVDWFAPTRLYGTPDDFRAFVDRAHALGLGVILDVVYNHLGPDGNFLGRFSPDYFTDRYTTDWGAAINYDGDNAGPVRDFVTANAAYWIDEFHLDGLRLDATQNIYDASDRHILADIGAAARRAAGRRSVILVNENEQQKTRLVRPVDQGGYGLDMLWNDDFHHSGMVALTGRREAYYTDYRGTPQEFVSMAKYGYLYQGQWYKWQQKRRGTPAFGLPPAAFVTFVQNHDQVANSARGVRHTAVVLRPVASEGNGQ